MLGANQYHLRQVMERLQLTQALVNTHLHQTQHLLEQEVQHTRYVTIQVHALQPLLVTQ